jgi:superfamily II helicase
MIHVLLLLYANLQALTIYHDLNDSDQILCSKIAIHFVKEELQQVFNQCSSVVKSFNTSAKKSKNIEKLINWWSETAPKTVIYLQEQDLSEIENIRKFNNTTKATCDNYLENENKKKAINPLENLKTSLLSKTKKYVNKDKWNNK